MRSAIHLEYQLLKPSKPASKRVFEIDHAMEALDAVRHQGALHPEFSEVVRCARLESARDIRSLRLVLTIET